MKEHTDPTVLIVDDEPDLGGLYAGYLRPKYTVRTATSGTEALEKVDDAVDVVLLDRRMPDLSGDEVLAELRDRGLECRVAMLTAVEPDGDIVDMPFDEYETKPVERSDLVGLVEVLLERASYDERSQEYFSLVSKKAALEIASNDNTEEYHELLDRVETVRAEIDAKLDQIGAEAAFSDLSTV